MNQRDESPKSEQTREISVADMAQSAMPFGSTPESTRTPAAPSPPPPPPAAAPKPPSPAAPRGFGGGVPLRREQDQPRHAADAALGGVAGASWAAADRKPAKEAGASSRAPLALATHVIDRLWHADEAAARVRRHPAWSEIARPPKGKKGWLSTAPAGKIPPEERDRRDVTRALARLPATEGHRVNHSLQEAVDDEGVFHRPLLAVTGRVEMAFDPRDALEAMAAAARPFDRGDPALADALAAAEAAVEPERTALPAAIEVFRQRLAGAFTVAAKQLPRDYLERAAVTALLREHRFAKRLVLGARHHCATLAIPGGPTLPLYLPEAAGPMLPLLERFEARVLVEPHPPQEADQDGVTLVALALARTVPMT